LFETKHYSLGDVVNESHFEKGNDSLARIMRSILTEYDSVSSKSYEYYCSHHSMAKVAEKFCKSLEQVQLKYGDIPLSLLKKGKILKSYESAADFFRSMINASSFSGWNNGGHV